MNKKLLYTILFAILFVASAIYGILNPDKRQWVLYAVLISATGFFRFYILWYGQRRRK